MWHTLLLVSTPRATVTKNTFAWHPWCCFSSSFPNECVANVLNDNFPQLQPWSMNSQHFPKKHSCLWFPQCHTDIFCLQRDNCSILCLTDILHFLSRLGYLKRGLDRNRVFCRNFCPVDICNAVNHQLKFFINSGHASLWSWVFRRQNDNSEVCLSIKTKSICFIMVCDLLHTTIVTTHFYPNQTFVHLSIMNNCCKSLVWCNTWTEPIIHPQAFSCIFSLIFFFS